MKNSKKPRIAVIGLKGLPAFGGAATVGENIINQLKDKYDFTVYSVSSHTDLKTGEYNGYKQIVFKKIPFKRLNTLYYYILSALHAVFLGKYDLIHLHHRDAAFIMLLLKIRYKVIITTHGSFFIRPKWKKYSKYFSFNEKYFVKYANIITCVSKNEQRLYIENVGIEPIYIPNGINDNFKILSQKELQKEDFIFFGAGRIIRTKGCDILLKALHILNYNGKVVIVGDLNQIEDYKYEILNLSKNLDVEFTGLIKDKGKLLSLLYISKLFVFPSETEAMSTMLLEAASVKTPIIASDIIPNKDIFDDNEVLFFKTNDEYDLANKIDYALNNYPIMLEKAGNAYNKLIINYNWINIAKNYNDLYKKLL